MPAVGKELPQGSDGAAGMRSVNRIAAVLAHVAERGPSSLSDIAEGTGLARPTVFRLLNALQQQGFVEADGTSGYRLGARFVYLAVRGAGIVDLRTVARPAMEKLSSLTGETVALSIRVGHHRMYIGQVESRQAVRRVVELDQFLPLHCGASARVLLAWLPPATLQEVVAKLEFRRYTERTLANPQALVQELERVRTRGYAISLGERVADGVTLAVPVVGQGGQVVAALAVIAPSHRVQVETMERWLPAVRETAREIAVAYGAVSPSHLPRTAVP